MATVLLKDLFDEAIKKAPKNYRPRGPGKRNKTGFIRLYKYKCPGCAQGFIWRYKIKTKTDQYHLSRTDLLRLKQDVIELGLTWGINDMEKALETIKDTPYTIDQLK